MTQTANPYESLPTELALVPPAPEVVRAPDVPLTPVTQAILDMLVSRSAPVTERAIHVLAQAVHSQLRGEKNLGPRTGSGVLSEMAEHPTVGPRLVRHAHGYVGIIVEEQSDAPEESVHQASAQGAITEPASVLREQPDAPRQEVIRAAAQEDESRATPSMDSQPVAPCETRADDPQIPRYAKREGDVVAYLLTHPDEVVTRAAITTSMIGVKPSTANSLVREAVRKMQVDLRFTGRVHQGGTQVNRFYVLFSAEGMTLDDLKEEGEIDFSSKLGVAEEKLRQLPMPDEIKGQYGNVLRLIANEGSGLRFKELAKQLRLGGVEVEEYRLLTGLRILEKHNVVVLQEVVENQGRTRYLQVDIAA